MYRPLKRLSRPTHDRSASNDGWMSGRSDSAWQLIRIATRVRPAAVTWWIT